MLTELYIATPFDSVAIMQGKQGDVVEQHACTIDVSLVWR